MAVERNGLVAAPIPASRVSSGTPSTMTLNRAPFVRPARSTGLPFFVLWPT